MAKSKWTKTTYKLDGGTHGWECKPGYNIFIADRGAVRFDFPADWVFEPETTTFKFHDRQPPDDDCTLEVSIFHLPPQVDWSELRLPQMLIEITGGEALEGRSQGNVVSANRPGLEIVWLESAWVEDGRDARSRQCLARGNDVQILVTMVFWAEHAERFIPVWDEALRTLHLGEYIREPVQRKN